MKRLFPLYIFSLLLLIFSACHKKEVILPPEVVTASPDSIMNTSVRVGGEIVNNGGAEIEQRGVYFGSDSNVVQTGSLYVVQPDSNVIQSDSNIFYLIVSDLKPGHKYYVNAFAKNSEGIGYGKESFFVTRVDLPTVITAAPCDFTNSSARLGGDVTNDGGFEVTERGIYWGDVPDVATNGMKVQIGSGTGNFSKVMTKLHLGDVYYVRAYAKNIRGTAMGKELIFSLKSIPPVVSTTHPYAEGPHKASVGGNVSYNGGSNVTERGIYFGTSSDPQNTGTKITIGNGTGTFSTELTQLKANTRYYVQAYAINSIGTSYGVVDTFRTTGNEPQISFYELKDLTRSSVVLVAVVTPNLLETTVSFDYGTTDAYGNTATVSNTFTGSSTDTVTATLSNLTMNTVYHFRVKASNELGTVYTQDSTFRTVITGITGSVTDRAGNTYATIGIGYQEWMTENLRNTILDNGDTIPMVLDDSLWSETKTPAYTLPECDSSELPDYGYLYNWYVVNSGNVCPDGWHVPTKEDFEELIDYLGGASQAGGKLKEKGTTHWKYPNNGATDEYHFRALPAGIKDYNGVYDYLGMEGNWWTSTPYGDYHAVFVRILYNYPNIYKANSYRKDGMSIRCVKDK